MSWLLNAYIDGRTYTTLAYMLLALPLGVLGFTVVVAGLSAGIGLLVTLAGVPVLVATLLFATAFARLERRLAWSLLDAPMPRSVGRPTSSRGIFWRRLSALGARARTWRELWFALLALPLGVVGFAVATSILWLMVAGFAQVVFVALGGEIQLGSWTVDTVTEALVFLPVSLTFLLVGPRVLLGWGTATGRAVTGILGRIEPAELKRGVVDVLARTGGADGFSILDDLRLRFGRGPFITPVQVEAALLALESTGTVRAERLGGRTSYHLA